MYNRIVDHSLVPHGTSKQGDRWAQGTVNSHIDQVQIALAIADESMLKTLLTDCTRPIAPLHQIGHTSSVISLRIPSGDTVDAVLTYDHIVCIPTDSDLEHEPFTPCVGKSATECQREIACLTRCESDLQTFVHHSPFAETLTALTYAGFSPSQIHTILNLPQDGWHKTWWYTLDENGEFSIPFHRRMRTRQYTDGTVTIQYKDHFPSTKPPCFSRQSERVLITIHREDQSFSDILSTINYGREQLGIGHAILICDRLSELEARGFLSQHVSLYSASDLSVSTHADCMICVNEDCPMSHRADSPVLTCRRFCVGDWP